MLGSTRPTGARRAPRRLAFGGVTAVAAAGLLLPLLPAGATAAPAVPARAQAATAAIARTSAATVGLFGGSDATYDGAFRQGLAITALAGARLAVPAASLAWLRRQQCADGGFEAFRPNLSVPCKPGSTTTFSGTDSNSTAAAALAFFAVGDTRRGRLAAAWLRRHQNRDGGFAFYPGAASDANSTGLALAALRRVGLSPRQVLRTRGAASAYTYLARLQAGCAATPSARGGIAYQAGSPLVPNDLATAQAAAGAAGTVPVTRAAATRPAARFGCVGTRTTVRPAVAPAAVAYLSRHLVAGSGTLPNAFGPGPDLSATAWAVLALVSARTGAPAITTALRALRRNAATYVHGRDGRDQPAALALLLLVARATGASPTSFGGVNLVVRLRASRQI